MKLKTLTTLFIGCSTIAFSQNYQPIGVTGFDQDIVAEATPAATTTSLSMDGSSYVFYSEAYGTAGGSTKGLPNSGLISDGANDYQLQDYSNNNALYLTNPGGSDTLVLDTPDSYASISLLGLSTEGAGVMDVKLIFTDGSSSTTTGLVVNDWFNGANFVMTDIDRVGRSNDNIAFLFGNPRLYDINVPVSCTDENKLLSEIVLTNQSTSNGRIYIMAVSGSDLLSVSLGNTFDLICNNGNDGFAEAVVSGGQSPYSFNWTNGPTSSLNVINTLSAGPHKCIVTDARGCVDSTAEFTLSEPAPINSNVNATTCAGYPYVIGSNYYYDAGTYNAVLQAANGCDSNVTVNLTVTPAPEYNESVTICAGSTYSIGNSNYTDAGVYRDTLSGFNFCDSIVVTTLTVSAAPSYNESVSICAGDSYSIGNNTYTISGVYSDTLSGVNTCDSIVITDLNVGNAEATISGGGGVLISTNTDPNFTYQWIDCGNNQAISGETNESYTITQNGSFALVVENGSCSDTSECFIVDNVSTDNIEALNNLSISPNPTKGLIYLTGDAKIQSASIYAANGQKIVELNEENLETIDLSNFDKGIYLIHILTEENTTQVFRVVKQ